MPGANESGELADAGIAADILREAGGGPDTVESDRDEQPEAQGARKRSPKAKASASRPSEATAESDDTTEELDAEQPEGEEPEGDEPEGDLPEGEEPEGEEADGDQPEGDEQDGNESEGEEPEGEQPEGAAPAGEERDETPEWARKRFAELTGQIRNLRAENERLRQGDGQTAARPTPVDLEVVQIESPEQLAQLRETAERLEEWAELHPNGVEADPDKPDQKSYTAEEVAQVRINARRRLRALDTRQRELADVQQFNVLAHQTYPEFNEPDSEESRILSWMLREVPEIRRLKNYRMIIGDAIAHDKQRRQQAKQATQTKKGLNGKPLAGKPAAPVNRKPPVVNGAPARGSAAPAGKFANRQKARDRAFKSGSEADIARLVEASLGS